MAGISDMPFRLINRSFWRGLAFTEMISANSLVHGSKKTLKMLSSVADDRPLGVQILGGDPETVRRSVDILSGYDFDIMDFNAACPANKVVSKGKGAALLKEPGRLQQMLSIVVERTQVPVTVKLRTGWDETSVNAVESALRARDAGVKAIFMHGRTRAQRYSGTVDYSIIRKVKESVEIPIIASGDALTPVLISKMFEETGCDGVAVARGALGNPWIFRMTAEHLGGKAAPICPDVREITQTMKEHLALNVAFHGQKAGVMIFRKFFSWYTKGMALKGLKGRAFGAVTWDEMLRLIEEVQVLTTGGECCIPSKHGTRFSEIAALEKKYSGLLKCGIVCERGGEDDV